MARILCCYTSGEDAALPCRVLLNIQLAKQQHALSDPRIAYSCAFMRAHHATGKLDPQICLQAD